MWIPMRGARRERACLRGIGRTLKSPCDDSESPDSIPRKQKGSIDMNRILVTGLFVVTATAACNPGTIEGFKQPDSGGLKRASYDA
jgi:hypothetical protein